jgi:putative two-component system response regulator
MSDAQNHDQQTVLVVEDNQAMLIGFRDILESSGYTVSTAPNGMAALEALKKVEPDLILSDISMPIMDGLELYKEVRKRPEGIAIPFIFVTARGTREDSRAALELGVDDYITKPVTSKELIAAVRARLDRADQIRLTQLKKAIKSSLVALANAIEARDQYTRQHVEQVNAFAQLIALDLDWRQDRREALEFGAILHDIGKIAVRESILTKPGPLDEDEWAEMRQHPIVGGRMIKDIPYLAPAIPIVVHHHERWDGAGYPDGLKGEEIPQEARLLAVADTFDAMTSIRPYRDAIPPKKAFDEIVSLSGKQFDPNMVETFARCWKRGEIEEILKHVAAAS